MIVLLMGLLISNTAGTAENYIGSKRCKNCHEFEYSVWERSAHNRAQTSLNETQRSDPKCNTCHTMAAELNNINSAVGCEKCHGPGKYYYPSYVMKDRELAKAIWLIEPKPEHCMRCHTEGAPSIRAFSFKEMWAKIDHGKRAKEAWQNKQKKHPEIKKEKPTKKVHK
ncbi:MAG: hypothetical protein JW841_01030 [Deltaproteobacteria bacterium]|nr:hypothetical protein [Deltaproteobacteria bacterium]